MLDKAKQLYQLQKEAKEVQKELKATEIEAKSNAGAVTVIFTGDQHIKSVDISEEWLKPERKRELEIEMVKVVSEAISRSQSVAAEKTKKLMGNMGLNIPGM
jgi:DNA-binding YbaB/EbfC family protein